MNESKPKRVKRQFDEAFRRNAAALVESSGRSLKEIAAELGVSHWNLRDWTKSHGRHRPQAPATEAETQREMARLRRENERLQARCEVLKKSTGHPLRTVGDRYARMKTLHGQYRIVSVRASAS